MSEQTSSPEVIKLDDLKFTAMDIRKVIGGAGHTLILDITGRLHACGWNNRGQTGIPESEMILNFKTVDSLANEIITDIACGWDCSLALNNNGEIYGWGSNNYGQLGLPPLKLQWSCEPRKVLIDDKIMRIAMGLRHSAVVTVDGRVLTTGSGNKGQLGIINEHKQKIHSLNVFSLGNLIISFI